MSRSQLALIYKYLKPLGWRIVVLAIFLMGTVILQLLMPQIIRDFLNAVQFEGSIVSLNNAVILYIGVVLLNQIIYAVATYLSEDIGWATTNMMRADLMLHCISSDMPFHKQHSSGEMIERIDGDILALSNFFSRFVIQIVGNIILLLLIIAVLLWENVLIGAVLITYIVVTLFYLLRLKGFSVPYFRKSREVIADAVSRWEAWLTATEDIRGIDGVEHVHKQNDAILVELLRRGRMANVMFRAFIGSVVGLVSLGSLAIFLTGTYLFSIEVFTIGDIYLALAYVHISSINVRNITDQMSDLQRATASLDRINLLYAETPAIVDGDQILTIQPGELRFEGVSFGYRPDNTILHDVSFSVKTGETMGIVGRTGSGKTTISRLMFRFYDPQEGSVVLDNINIRDLQVNNLRQQVGYIPQEVQLFHGKLRDNFTFFDTSIHDSDIYAALEEIELITWFNSLEEGLDTSIDGNNRFSAGEAQLIAFVRILLKNPAVVVLDEASARIDPVTEHRLQKSYDKLFKNRIGIIIAHRLATIRDVDKILMLDNGKVMEYGWYSDLSTDETSRFYDLLQNG